MSDQGQGRPCKYGCGATIMFFDKVGRPPYVEVETHIHHTYNRCAQLLKAQGRDPTKEFDRGRRERLERNG